MCRSCLGSFPRNTGAELSMCLMDLLIEAYTALQANRSALSILHNRARQEQEFAAPAAMKPDHNEVSE